MISFDVLLKICSFNITSTYTSYGSPNNTCRPTSESLVIEYQNGSSKFLFFSIFIMFCSQIETLREAKLYSEFTGSDLDLVTSYAELAMCLVDPVSGAFILSNAS